MHDAMQWLVEVVSQWGYTGVFLLMFLESTLVPVPSELVMIPAGYLASKGEMNVVIAIITGTLGSLGGASLNYFLAMRYGRDFLLKIGKYIFFNEAKLHKVEIFFDRHGSISTFMGRLVLGIRHFISLPAGLARMDFGKFALYTTAGSFIWMCVLVALGYFIGDNEETIKIYAKQIAYITALVMIVGFAIYMYIYKIKHKNESV